MSSGFGGGLLRSFDIPEDALGGVPRVTLVGNGSVLIENHRGLFEYSPELIVVNGGRISVSLRGDGLELVAMNRGELRVTGRIFSVELE